jgi:hypothetical protein
MLRKPDQGFGVLPVTGMRLACDFSAMKNARPQRVRITRVVHFGRPLSMSGKLLGRTRKFSRATRCKNLIRLYWIEKMRGASTEPKPGKQQQPAPGRTSIGDRRIRRTGNKSGRRLRRSISISRRFGRDSSLLYLTGRRISDNRHALLTKFESGRVAKTLSAINPRV